MGKFFTNEKGEKVLKGERERRGGGFLDRFKMKVLIKRRLPGNGVPVFERP
jgi:hypothetical protein